MMGLGAPVQDMQQQQQQQQQQQLSRNPAFLCKMGCETVQEIVVRTSEVFSHLKNMQLPNGTQPGIQQSHDKKIRIQEYLATIQRQFRTLRVIYTRVNDECSAMEYTPHIETLIPYKEESDKPDQQKKIGENYRYLVEESRDLKEQLSLKARYMKDII